MRDLVKPELEKALLSAIKQEPLLIDQYQVREDLFMVGAHRAIFRAIQKIVDAGSKPDDVAVLDAAGAKYAPEIMSLTLPTMANASHYVAELNRFAELRKLRTIGQWVQDAIENGKDADEVREKVDRALTRMEDHANLVEVGSVLSAAIEEVEASFNRKGALAGIPTGFSHLDRAFNGMQPGLLYILAARPSIGKTAMALTIATNQAKQGYQVGFFSCEMSNAQLAKRMMASESRLDLIDLNSGFLPASAFHKLTDAASKLYSMPMLLDDTPNPTLAHIKAVSRQMKRKGVQIIYIDYMTLIQHGTESTPRHERVGQIAKQLKQLARELEVPFVLLSQVRRDSEGRAPNLADLRQSGEIEEDADVVFFLHRETRSGSETSVDIAKNRQGPTYQFDVMFLAPYVRFEESEGGHYDSAVANREAED